MWLRRCRTIFMWTLFLLVCTERGLPSLHTSKKIPPEFDVLCKEEHVKLRRDGALSSPARIAHRSGSLAVHSTMTVRFMFGWIGQYSLKVPAVSNGGVVALPCAGMFKSIGGAPLSAPGCAAP